MAKPLVQFLAETSGSCCVYGFLTQPKFKKLSNVKLAATLGIGTSAVSEARVMLKEGGYACRGGANCTKNCEQ